jgi:hypothetical protein
MTQNDDIVISEQEAPPTPPPPQQPPSAQPATRARQKAPAGAAVLSFFMPGLGHLYAEAYEKAVMIFGGFILVIFAMANNAFPIPLGVLSCIFLWFFGMFDGYREAQLANLDGVEPEPKPRRSGEGRLMFGIFLAVVGCLLLVENLDLFDLDWLFEWWPVMVVAVGVYLIAGAVRERVKRQQERDLTEGESFDG